MKYALPGSGDVPAIKADGTVAPVVDADGCTLTAGTWYFPWGGEDSPLPGETPNINVQLEWAAAVAGVFTFETTNFPHRRGGGRAQGKADVADNVDNATAARTNWVQQNPPTLYVPTPTGAGNSATGLVITAGGTTGGGTMVDIGNLGARRGHVKAVLTVGGRVRCAMNGKAGG